MDTVQYAELMKMFATLARAVQRSADAQERIADAVEERNRLDQAWHQQTVAMANIPGETQAYLALEKDLTETQAILLATQEV